MIRFGGVLVVLALALGACSFGPSPLEILESNLMANATVSFAEPTSRIGVDGNPDPFIGIPSATSFRMSWRPIPTQLVDQGLQELLDQSEEAGFSLELVKRSEAGDLRFESWEGFDADGIFLQVRLTEDSLSVFLG